MTVQTRISSRLGAVSALALALAACGPDETAGTDQLALTSALGPYNYSLEEEDWDAGGDVLPEALPMQADYPGGPGPSYAPAPSWNYADGGYYDDGYASGWDDSDYGYYDAGYADDYYDSYGDDYYYDDTVGSDQYAWLALAALIGGLLADSPPDYGYYYDGAQPWAWRTHDGYYRYAEPVRGGYRYYYYEPRSTRPFLVRDPLYSYGYRESRLVVVYDRDGRILRDSRARDRRRVAASYFDRGERLYTAAHRGDRFGVSAPLWQQRRSAFRAEQDHWERARAQRSEWRDWNSSHEKAAERRWERERRARRVAANRFDSWREEGYRNEAPRLYRERTGDRPRIERASLVREQERADRQAERRRADREPVRADNRERRREVRRDRERIERSAGFARAEVQRGERRQAALRDRGQRQDAERDDRRREFARQERAQNARDRQHSERNRQVREQRALAQRERRQQERAQEQRAQQQDRRQQAQRERQRAENDRRQQERAQEDRRQRQQAQRQQAQRERQQAERRQQQRQEAQQQRQRQQSEQAQRERQQRQQAERRAEQQKQAQRERQRAESNRNERSERGNGRGRDRRGD
ncbi:hypothetical protein [Aurantiacibacter odishensis]|uniref:hypothetical protein n=1 Tax=Aurantiacibacter odishensis TaxID=1155476 RepID=UPI000E75CAFE|nr:hypothetical protein [Aurantiacibacter odishensis]